LFQIFITLLNYPNFLGYANFINQADKYKYLSDSDLDSGQDVKKLSLYIKDKKTTIRENLFGVMDTELYNIPYSRFGPSWLNGNQAEDCRPLGPGVYAISATQLTGTFLRNHECFKWLKEKGKLVKILGSSIYIFQI